VTLREIRPASICRSWLFVEGANESALRAAASCGADVLIQELEDFTTPAQRPLARALAPGIFAAWRAAGAVVAVRVNPLAQDGMDDLAAVMRGKPDIVALPKVSTPQDIVDLERAVTRFEREYDIPDGATALMPNIESARGLVATREIAQASRRVTACLMASEDLAADLGVERTREGIELTYCRQRFFVECVAAGVVAVDCPYTFSDADGAARDAKAARAMGYVAKSLVDAGHAGRINEAIGPGDQELKRAAGLVAAFEDARQRGLGRASFEGALVEIPAYTTAKRLIARGEAIQSFAATRSR
jgi:citrate lyase subunit beta/citryl-CoA lyase